MNNKKRYLKYSMFVSFIVPFSLISCSGSITNNNVVRNEYNYVESKGNIVETTLGIEETPDLEKYTPDYVNLSTNRVALMSYYLEKNSYNLPASWYTYDAGEVIEPNGTTIYSSTMVKAITVCCETSGLLYVSTASLKDIYKARIKGSSYSVNNLRSYKVNKGLNKLYINTFVDSDSTLLLGGNGSVNLFYAKGINKEDHQGNFAYLNGESHSSMYNETSSIKDKLCIEAEIDSSILPIIENVKDTYHYSLDGYSTNNPARYVYYYNDDILLGKTLKYIEIPVKAVSQINGNQVFTLAVCDKDQAINQSIFVGNEYRLTLPISSLQGKQANSVNSWIMVDISKYNISLTANQVLVFGKESDTVEWVWHPYNYCLNECFYSSNASGQPMSAHIYLDPVYGYLPVKNHYDNLNLMFNLYAEGDTGSVHADKIRNSFKLIDKINGLQMSMIGDSISTFEGVNNNSSLNSTIGGNAVFYHNKWRFNPDYDSDSSFVIDKPGDTWWGRTVDKTGMKLCINGAWSGSRTMGEGSTSNQRPAACNSYRPYNLHRNDGTTPDVIIVYMGTNDKFVIDVSPERAGNCTDYNKIDNLVNTQTKNQPCDNSSLNFGESYALMIAKMRKAYPNAKIFCANILFNGGVTTKDLENFASVNTAIEGVANHYNLPIIDFWGKGNDGSKYKQLNGYYDAEYYSVRDWLHPAESGMKNMSEMIIERLTRYFVNDVKVGK